MKKINLFLWGIVSTCITFFYRTEISAYTLFMSKNTEVDSCDGYSLSIIDLPTKLENAAKKQLCSSTQMLYGCMGNGVCYVNRMSLDELAKCCQGKSGMCVSDCPEPGSKQTRPGPTTLYEEKCVTFCSFHNGITNELYAKQHLQTICLKPAGDSSDFDNINIYSNTCAINAGEECDDDTGECEYADKCFYTE